MVTSAPPLVFLVNVLRNSGILRARGASKEARSLRLFASLYFSTLRNPTNRCGDLRAPCGFSSERPNEFSISSRVKSVPGGPKSATFWETFFLRPLRKLPNRCGDLRDLLGFPANVLMDSWMLRSPWVSVNSIPGGPKSATFCDPFGSSRIDVEASAPPFHRTS